jgi:NADH-quinone oxidoreductase subunit M
MNLITLSLIELLGSSALCILVKKYAGQISTLALLIATLLLLFQGQNFYVEYEWIKALGINFGIYLDKLSFPLTLIILLISCLASFFSIDFMKGKKNLHFYFSNLIWFATGMYGVLLSTNFVQFYLFWELMIIPPYFLIAYWGHGKASRIALKFFIYMHASALLILFSIFSLYLQTHTFEILEIIKMQIPLEFAKWVALLLLLGIGIKMAIVPLHGWLPDAHSEAPAPISAILSGLMIKVGAYAIARFVLPLFGIFLPFYSFWLLLIALITMFYGALMAFAQVDIKRLFAYSSISQIGYIFFALFLFNPIAYAGSILHIINHALVKALLFFISGILVFSTGQRNMKKLGGLLKLIPTTTFAALVGALALSGVPLFNIFVSEWLIFQGGIMQAKVLETGIAIGVSLMTTGYSLWMIKRVFFGKLPKGIKVKEPTLKMKITVILISILIIAIGVWPSPLIEMLM